jgi:hypothetical protein
MESTNTCGFGQGTDLPNVNPQLQPLADNGGPTQTHALPATSPALDAGEDDGCPATDQRGVTRPQDGDQDGSATCDIGAYEYQVPQPTPTPTAPGSATPTPPGGGAGGGQATPSTTPAVSGLPATGSGTPPASSLPPIAALALLLAAACAGALAFHMPRTPIDR